MCPLFLKSQVTRKPKSIPRPRHVVGNKATEITAKLWGLWTWQQERVKGKYNRKLELKRYKKITIIKSYHQERIQWTAGMLLLCKITIKRRLMSFPTNYPVSRKRHTKRFHFTSSNSFPYLCLTAIHTIIRLLAFFLLSHPSHFCQRTLAPP